MPKQILALTYFIVGYISVFAQNKRFSFDIEAGVPVPITSISPGLSMHGGIGIRYNITRTLSVEGLVHAGKMQGKQEVAAGQSLIYDPATSYTGFTNNFFQYTGTINYNLKRAIGLESKLKLLNPYMFIGAGWINYDAKATRIDGRIRAYNNQFFYTGFGGLAVRYYLTPKFDIVASIGLYFTQTAFIDAIPTDNNRYDKYMLNAVGISYKIGARKGKEHIEWSKDYRKKKRTLPKMEQKSTDGNSYALKTNKDSINKVQTQQHTEQIKPQLTDKYADTLQQQARLNEPKQSHLSDSSVVPIKPANSIIEPTKTALNNIDSVTTPQYKYNIITGAYSTRQNAFRARNRMRTKGYHNASVFRSDNNSGIFRVMIFATDDKKEALRVLRKIRIEIDPRTWIFIYQ